MEKRWAAHISISLLLFCGCLSWSENNETKPESACDGVVEAVFDITPGVNWTPFPFDYFTTPDPTSPVGLKLSLGDYTPPMIRGTLNGLPFLKDALDELRGFGVHSRVLIPISGDLDPSSLPGLDETLDAKSPIVVFPIAPDGSPGPLVPFYASINHTLKSIELTPLISWPNQATLVVAVRQELFDWSQRPLCPSEQFLYMTKSEKDASYPNSEFLEPMRVAYQPILESTEDVGIERDELAVAFWFTTQATTKVLHDARRYLDSRAQTAPPFPADMTIEESSYPELAFIGYGHLSIPNFRDGDGVFYLDPTTGQPTPILPDESVEFLFTMPNPDQSDYPQPYPAAIYIHGVSGQKESVLSLARYLANWGIAFFAIDLSCHGSRSTYPPEMAWFCYFNFTKPLAMRDNLRQNALDNIWLAKMIKNLDQLDLLPYTSPGEYGDGTPDLDTSHIFLLGHSLGTFVGTLATAASPEILSIVSAAAGGYMVEFIDQHWVKDVIMDIINRFTDFEFPETLAIMFDLYQMVLDAGDAANYIAQLSLVPEPDINTLKDALVIESVGDTTLPNASTALYALHGDIPIVEPYVYEQPGLRIVESPAEGWGLFQYDSANHNLIFSNDSNASLARYQAGYFFRSRVTDKRATIINPFEYE